MVVPRAGGIALTADNGKVRVRRKTVIEGLIARWHRKLPGNRETAGPKGFRTKRSGCPYSHAPSGLHLPTAGSSPRAISFLPT